MTKKKQPPKQQPRASQADPTHDVITTKAELARVLRLSPPTINKWARRPGFPGGMQGPWDAAACAEFLRAAADSEKPGRPASDEEQSLYRNKAAKLAEEVRRLKLKNDLLEGDMLRKSEVLQAAGELVLRIKTRLEALPDELEMRFPRETRAENKADLAAWIAQLLTEMSEWECT